MSNLIEEARLEEPTFLNLVSSIFNLMNAVIGAGIIGKIFTNEFYTIFDKKNF